MIAMINGSVLKAAWRVMMVAMSLATAASSPALAQNLQGIFSVPVTGGTKSSLDGPNNIKGANNFTSSVAVHMSPAGKACISANAFSRAQIVNPNIAENVVLLTNICAQPIKLRLCYLGSTNCITPTVGSYRRQEAILGYSPGAQEFRYQYREQF